MGVLVCTVWKTFSVSSATIVANVIFGQAICYSGLVVAMTTIISGEAMATARTLYYTYVEWQWGDSIHWYTHESS